MPLIAENLARVEDSMAAACRKAGRPRAEVALMAVSKTHPVEYLIEAAQAGHRLFGENRVQEFSAKTAALHAQRYTITLHSTVPSDPQHSPLQVHLIGHLQSNKSTHAAEIFTSIDTIDSLKLAERLNQSAQKLSRVLPILIEIKLSHEESKEGLAPASPGLSALLEHLPELTHLRARGLMTVAPMDEDPNTARTCFRTLRTLRDTLAHTHPRLSLEELSMGMSGDFEAAIEEGSTQVRIGTAIFGARPKPGP
jgi:pyridoxal phosphate enzyme (YggS family)